MRDRRLAAIGLLALFSVTGISGGRSFSTEAAPAAQFELVRAAIHPGSCAEPEPLALVTLNSFNRVGAPDEPGAPLSSNTDVPVPLPELLAAPHAILVTLGGDLAATLVCGEIGDVATAILTIVALDEANDSGLSGFSTLLARDDGTRVTVFLEEVADDASPEPAAPPGPAGTPATSPVVIPIVTPSSIGGEPSPTSTAVAGGGPAIPIFLPPVAQDAPPTPGVAPIPGVAPGTYTSQEFGYSIAIPAGWEIVGQPQVEPGADYIHLTNGPSGIDFLGVAAPRTAPECLDVHYDAVRSLPNLSVLLPHTGPDAAVVTSTPERAIEVWDVTLIDSQGQPVPLTLYVDCRALQPGVSILLTTHEAPAALYQEQIPLRDEVYRGLTLP